MKPIAIKDIADHEGEIVTLAGWLYNKRSSGKIHFLHVRDGTGIIQCVISQSDVPERVFLDSDTIQQESSLVITGRIQKDPRSPLGYEIHASDIRIIQLADGYPITKKEHGTSFLMEHRHLWLRSSRQQAILRVRAEVIKASRRYFDDHGFILLDAPIFTPSSCEGTTTLFETDYFDEKAYLTQSGQLYMEAGAMAFGKVYCFGPTFRAEKSKTRRHLTEFWMVEPEVAFCELDGIMDIAEDYLIHLVQSVITNCSKELEHLDRDMKPLENICNPFPRIRYDEALNILHEEGVDHKWGDDFGGDEETVISRLFDRPVMITHYPRQLKPFYMKSDPKNEDLTLCLDVLAPEGYGEIIGGSQREDDFDTLKQRIVAAKLSLKDFEWYLDIRRYGSVPHSGFGLGIERTVSWLCGLKHVRETIPFPRLMGRLRP